MTVAGHDRPGLTAALCTVLDRVGARILDVEQVTIRDRLTLGFLVAVDDGAAAREELARTAGDLALEVTFDQLDAAARDVAVPRAYVTVLGHPLRPSALAALTGAIADHGANIDSITRLSKYPILSFELLVSGGDHDQLRAALTAEAARQGVDVAVQRAGLHRRAKRLLCLDVDSTLVDGEVIELLAQHAGHAAEVAAITERAMAGELDFEASLRTRVALLAGTPVEALDEVRAALRLMPGARTLVRTLHRLGFVLAMVSGGFTQITEPLRADLGIAYGAANELEVAGGRLTGRLVGPVLDRAGKADVLERFARDAGVPLAQTVAVGDGANDVDMLSRAGLGIAFNAKAVAREAADTALSVPYLDAILFLLGITREEVEAADAEDPAYAGSQPPAVPLADG